MKTIRKTLASIPKRLHRLVGLGMVALILLGAVFTAGPALTAQAAVPLKCISIQDGDWSNPQTWSCDNQALVPAASSEVVVTHFVSLGKNWAVKSLTVTNNLEAENLGVLQFSAPVTLTLSGNLDISAYAIFDPGFGTVQFGPGSQTILTHGKWVDFWNLTKISTAADTLSFDPAAGQVGGPHILSHLILRGAGINYLSLRSTVPGSTWQIWPEQEADILAVDIKDGANVSPVMPQIPVLYAVNSGNNTGWVFNQKGAHLESNKALTKQGSPVTLTVYLVNDSDEGEVQFVSGDEQIDGCEDIPMTGAVATCTTTELALGAKNVKVVFQNAAMTDVLVSNIVDLYVAGGIYYLPAIGN